MGSKNTSNMKPKDFYSMSPTRMEDKNLPKSFMNFSKSKSFTVYELFDGVDFNLVVDDNIIIHADSNSDEIVELFNNMYVKPLSRLIQHIGESINFTLYGTYISHDTSKKVGYVGPPKIFFYDMYFNSNWLRNDDFVELLPKFGLDIAPVIHYGTMNMNAIKYINHAIDSPSNVNGVGGVFGVYFKSLNGIGEHRGIEKGAYTFYNEKYKKNEKSISKKKEAEIKEKVEELAYFTVTDEVMDGWEAILKARNIEKTKKNIDKIMPIVMSNYIAYHTEDRELLALEINTTEVDTEKYIKKYVSGVIVKKFFNRG